MFDVPLISSTIKSVAEKASQTTEAQVASKFRKPIETRLSGDGIRPATDSAIASHYDATYKQTSRSLDATQKAAISAKVQTLEGAGFSKAEIAKIQRTMEHQATIPSVSLSKSEISALVDKNYSSVHPDQNKQMHLILGNSGAGKSHYIADGLVSRDNARLLDADHIKPQIQGYDRGSGNQAVHKASTEVVNAMMLKSIKNGDNIVHSMCGTTVESVETKLNYAKAHGYDVHLHLADIPAEESARRVFERGFNAPATQEIRQMIPPTYPLEVGSKPVTVFNQIKDKPDYLKSYAHLDTNVPRGHDANIVAQGP